MVKKIAILGMGISGLGVAEFLLKKGLQILIWDENRLVRSKNKKYKKFLVDLSVSDWKDIDCLVLSPGIPLNNLLVKEAKKRSVKIIGDMELLWDHIYKEDDNIKIIGVTGTNGKSTVTSMISEVLGVKPIGNIGTSVLDIDNKKKNFMVVELSSFQLDLVNKFSPHISTIINLRPDHIEHHGSYELYKNAKRKIYQNQNKKDFIVINTDDPILQKEKEIILEKAIHPNIINVSIEREVDNGVSIIEGLLLDNISTKESAVLDLSNGLYSSRHNILNFAISYAICKIAGYTKDKILKSLLGFKGLSHRIEYIGSFNKIDFFNDSKATNVAATDSALLSFNKLVWIAGGKNKGDDFSYLKKHSEKIMAAYFIGESRYDMFKIFNFKKNIYTVRDIHRATVEAYKFAFSKKEKPPVVLSPACSSYDQFENYEDRGLAFKRVFQSIVEGKSNVT